MVSLDVLLLLAAFVCEVLAALGVSARVNLMALGLACFFATLLF